MAPTRHRSTPQPFISAARTISTARGWLVSLTTAWAQPLTLLGGLLYFWSRIEWGHSIGSIDKVGILAFGAVTGASWRHHIPAHERISRPIDPCTLTLCSPALEDCHVLILQSQVCSNAKGKPGDDGYGWVRLRLWASGYNSGEIYLLVYGNPCPYFLLLTFSTDSELTWN